MPKIVYTKPHLPYARQVDLLRSRGMTVPNQVQAIEALEKIGYYRLSGYWYSFKETIHGIRTENFVPGTNFDDIVNLYFFDKKLRLLLLDALECLEISMRVQVAHVMGADKKFSYDNPLFYKPEFLTLGRNGLSPHQEWLARFNKNVHRSKNEYFVGHYCSKYLPPFPIWIAVQLWDFGLLSHFFAGLKPRHQQNIAQALRVPKGIYLENWLHCLNDIRNLAAHHCRIWNRNLVTQPRLPRRGEIALLDPLARCSIKKIYACCCIMAYLLEGTPLLSEWKTCFTSHIETFPNLSILSIADMGFPFDWKKQDIWKDSIAIPQRDSFPFDSWC